MDAKRGGGGVRILMCKLKAQMDKGGYSDVEMKRWMKKGAM